MHVPILEAIAAAKMAAVGNVAPIAFLLTHQGRPYSAGISNAIRAWCRQAGCHIAPLIRSRKGTLTMLADKSRRVAHPTGRQLPHEFNELHGQPLVIALSEQQRFSVACVNSSTTPNGGPTAPKCERRPT